MTEQAVHSWMQDLLVREVGMGASEAAETARACSHWRGEFSLEGAATVAMVALATPRLPGGVAWWSGAGSQARRALVGGHIGEVEDQVGEALAEPAPDEWDPNWPDWKTARGALVDGTREGDEYVLGNGMGYRGSFRVVNHDGVLSAVLIDSSWSLAPLWDEAWPIAEALFVQDAVGTDDTDAGIAG